MSEQTDQVPPSKSELQAAGDDVSSAIVQFSAVEAGFAELRSKYEKVVFDVTTAEGLKDAKEARAEIREPRYSVERTRKEAKTTILELGRRLDSRAKKITDDLLELEEPIDMQIKQEEGRKDRERQEKIDAEAKRVETIQQRITDLRSAAQSIPLMGPTAATKIAEIIAKVEAVVVDESFAEFQQQAADARLAALATLRQFHTAAVDRETEQVRIQAEREELTKLREEAARREAADRARREEEEKKARAARDEQERKARAEREELDRIERDRLAEQRRQQEAEQARIDAENKRLADERAEIARQQEEARRKAAADEQAQRNAEAAERKRREQIEAQARKAKYPGEAAIVAALAKHFDVADNVVRKWLTALRAAA